MVYDKEMISVILNALTDEQGNLISTKEEEAVPSSNYGLSARQKKTG